MLSDKADGEFTDDDQAVLIQLTQMAAVAVENLVFAAEREDSRMKEEFLSILSHELRHAAERNAVAGCRCCGANRSTGMWPMGWMSSSETCGPKLA